MLLKRHNPLDVTVLECHAVGAVEAENLSEIGPFSLLVCFIYSTTFKHQLNIKITNHGLKTNLSKPDKIDVKIVDIGPLELPTRVLPEYFSEKHSP
jgi:hypothetical protein